MTEAYDGRQVVGMDLHRRRSVLVRMTEDGRKLLHCVRGEVSSPQQGEPLTFQELSRPGLGYCLIPRRRGISPAHGYRTCVAQTTASSGSGARDIEHAWQAKASAA